MKNLFLSSALLCVIIQSSFAQNAVVSKAHSSLVTYSRELNVTSQTNKRIFDKSLIWFYRSFFHNYDKIIIKNRTAGMIVGRALLFSTYKVPGIADSTNGLYYTDYNFEWTIKIENGKIKFLVTNIYINKHTEGISETIVTTATKIPFKVISQTDAKMEKDWSLSKSYLINNLDALVDALNTELGGNDDDLGMSIVENSSQLMDHPDAYLSKN